MPIYKAPVEDTLFILNDVLGIERFMLHISVGTLQHKQVLQAIRLLGTEVADRVRSSPPARG